MAEIIRNKKTIEVGSEPIVVFPLKRWEEMRELLEDLEDTIRYYRAISDPENQEKISFEEVKKKLSLP